MPSAMASSRSTVAYWFIDGERLVELLLGHGLGIKQLTVVDERFFAPFR